jgi:hypothetical protein
MKRLACGHEYHGACLDTWVDSGKGDCPLCRRVFVNTYKMTVTIENARTGQRVLQDDRFSDDAVHRFLDRTEFEFQIGTLDQIRSILAELGLEVDTSALDAE